MLKYLKNYCKRTNHFKKYWQNRKLDWEKDYASTPNHPHRDLIIERLKKIRFKSLMEIGCNAGPNLLRIQEEFPKAQLGGIDINADAIATAQRLLPKWKLSLEVRSADNIFFSSKSIDVILTDALLIYIGGEKINKVLSEIKRMARNYVIFCEFHSESWLKRLGLKLVSGYNAYDYKKLLEKHDFWNIQVEKIPRSAWPDLVWNAFGYIIQAQL